MSTLIHKRWKWWEICPLCHNSEISFMYGVSGNRLGATTENSRITGIYTCQSCSLTFLNPQPVGDISWLYPPAYLSDSKHSTGLSAWYRQDQYAFDFGLWSRATGKSVREMGSYLDIGAGSGERVAFLDSQSVSRVYGLDRYDQQPTAGKEFLQNGEVELFFPHKKFAVVGLFHVLEHVPNPSEILRHIHTQLLISGGEVIIQVPNFGSAERKLFGGRWYGLDVPRHFWHFTDETLQALLTEAGFTIIAVHKKNAWLHPVTFIGSLIPAFDVQQIWVEKEQLSVFAYWVRYIGWILGTVLSIPWSVVLSAVSQGSMLTIVARKE